jgi:hypothetical protein
MNVNDANNPTPAGTWNCTYYACNVKFKHKINWMAYQTIR